MKMKKTKIITYLKTGILFLVIFSCKKNKNSEIRKTISEQTIVESKVGFYSLFLEYETKQEFFKKFPIDTSKYFKTYIIQGQSKLIDRQFENIKPSNILTKKELNKLNSRTVFENYQSDFIDIYEFNSKKYDTNKTEIIYFFTYPFSIAKNKVLIGFEIKSKSHHLKETTKRIYMGFILFKKIDNKWNFIEQKEMK
jgi:hypothetical protein